MLWVLIRIADDQPDSSLCWAHMLFCWFCRAVAPSHILEFIKLKTFFDKEKRFLPTDPALFDRVE